MADTWIDRIASIPVVFWTLWALIMGGSLCALCVFLLRSNRKRR
jgi:hypothetical protein